jgi:hypothetical protein
LHQNQPRLQPVLILREPGRRFDKETRQEIAELVRVRNTDCEQCGDFTFVIT